MKHGLSRKPRRGFALVIVLWTLAGLAVVAAAVAATSRTANLNIKLLRDRVQAEAAFISTAARIQAFASTNPAGRSHFGRGRVRLTVDGTPLIAGDDERVVLQDLRGLVNVNQAQPPRVLALLKACGISDTLAPRLSDALADYIDSDGLKRVNGAEAFEYRAAGLPEPRNQRLITSDELWRVFGWRDAQGVWRAAGCEGAVTVHGDGMINRNTAPVRVLLADGISDTSAAGMIEARREGLPAVAIQTSTPEEASNPFGFIGGGFVGPAMRVSHSAGWIQWQWEYVLDLTPSRNGGPWRLLEVRTPARTGPLPAATRELPPANRVFERDPNPDDALSRSPFLN
jgi:hypothetical protein